MAEESLFESTIRFHLTGNLSEALTGYRQLLLNRPDDFVVMNNLSALVQPEEAEKLLRDAIKLRPNYVAAYNNLGELLDKKGNKYEAIQCFEAALRSDATDTRALENIKRLVLAPGNLLLSEKKENVSYYPEWKAGVENSDYFFPTFHSIPMEFWERLLLLKATLPEKGKFLSDNLICWERSLSFLEDKKFISSVESNFDKINCLWRVAVVAWGARQGLRLEGDFVECGTYKGGTAKILCEYLDIDATSKTLWMYDVFDWSENDKHFYISGLNKELHDFVTKRFEDVSNIRIVKGYVPESFAQGAPEKIAFMHVDMNNADAELGALEHLWEKVVPGAVVVFDDYGWAGLRPQKDSADAFLAKLGYNILELPTGQGFVIK